MTGYILAFMAGFALASSLVLIVGLYDAYQEKLAETEEDKDQLNLDL